MRRPRWAAGETRWPTELSQRRKTSSRTMIVAIESRTPGAPPAPSFTRPVSGGHTLMRPHGCSGCHRRPGPRTHQPTGARPGSEAGTVGSRGDRLVEPVADAARRRRRASRGVEQGGRRRRREFHAGHVVRARPNGSGRVGRGALRGEDEAGRRGQIPRAAAGGRLRGAAPREEEDRGGRDLPGQQSRRPRSRSVKRAQPETRRRRRRFPGSPAGRRCSARRPSPG